jgi:uncharacterized HAD superfamily protein/adenine/guanine phosphoribosyltransferase-like PRPP-binding protein
MQYRSIADMNDVLLRNLHRFPQDIDLVVGVPRSGLLAANLLCLALNVPMTDVDGVLEKRIIATGTTRPSSKHTRSFDDVRTILVVDDCVGSGRTMAKIRARLSSVASNYEFIYCAVYGEHKTLGDVDLLIDEVIWPYMFQWNFMHHGCLLDHCMFDIDGVLCLDPSHEDDDDGVRYEKFLDAAVPMFLPTRRIGGLVTSRLEKWRPHTERWLEKQGVQYGELHMTDLPNVKVRERLHGHAQHKADIYAASPAQLFIESSYDQAKDIARLSGKPVLCIEAQHVIYPNAMSPAALRQMTHNLPLRLKLYGLPRVRKVLKALVGPQGYSTLRAVAGRR